MSENKEIKQEVKQELATYDKAKIEQAVNLLNTINVTGVNQANILCQIFNIVANPINVENK